VVMQIASIQIQCHVFTIFLHFCEFFCEILRIFLKFHSLECKIEFGCEDECVHIFKNFKKFDFSVNLIRFHSVPFTFHSVLITLYNWLCTNISHDVFSNCMKWSACSFKKNRWQWCWWQHYVGHNFMLVILWWFFKMLVTESLCWRFFRYVSHFFNVLNWSPKS